MTEWETAVPERVMRALDRVLVDTQDAHPLDLELGWDPRPQWPVLWIRGAGAPTADRLRISPHWEGEDLVRGLADGLPGQHPACPGHPHAATTDIVDGEAWWVCPGTRRRVARIGDLARIRSERPKVTFPRKGTVIRVAGPPGAAGASVAVHAFVDVRDDAGLVCRWRSSTTSLAALPASGLPLPGLDAVCELALDEWGPEILIDLFRAYAIDLDALDDIPIETYVEWNARRVPPHDRSDLEP